MSVFSFSRLGVPAPSPATKAIKRLALLLIGVGLIGNEWFMAGFFSPDGILEASTLISTRLLQLTLIFAGLSMLLQKKIILLALVCMLPIINVSVFRGQVKRAVAKNDRIAEDRLRELRASLPSEGRVGYLSNENRRASSASMKRYYLTQYAVAPVVLEEGPTQKLVIANFEGADLPANIKNFDVIRDFGGGLILLRKRSE
jgi:hypothetical protein